MTAPVTDLVPAEMLIDEPLEPDLLEDSDATSRQATTRRLLDALEKLPVQESAALYVVQVADDPGSSAKDVGLGIAADPALTTRVLRLANSAYYGMSGRVATPAFAVTLLGRDTVRAIAAAAAAGAVGSSTELPDHFWSYSSATAAAAALVAPRVGANRSEAFCLGLLHDLGAALLHQTDPAERSALVQSAITGLHPTLAEVPAFGIAHPEAGQRVLAAWRFPIELTDAVGQHHAHPRDALTGLARSLHAAKAIVRDLPGVPAHEAPTDIDAALRAGRLSAREVPALRQQVLEQAGQLAATLSAGPGTATL